MDIRRLKDGYDVMDKLYNASTWFKHESSQRMLRTLDGSARAYLSNRYRYIDNIDIAGVTLPILNRLPDIRFESCQITESHMYIKAVPPTCRQRYPPATLFRSGPSSAGDKDYGAAIRKKVRLGMIPKTDFLAVTLITFLQFQKHQ